MASFPQHQWQVLSLPARYFSWRIRGNALSWALGHRDILSKPYDLLVATSMVDLATLKGLLPSAALLPSVLYFHENQFAYPVNDSQHKSIEPMMVTLYSALSATRLCFNSQYNQDSFLYGAAELLSKFPDHVPAGIINDIRKKSRVLPVPLEPTCFFDRTSVSIDKVASGEHHPSDKISHKTIDIVWNHRWEYDKGPDRLLAVIEALPKHLVLRFHILGQSFRKHPPQFERIHEVLRQRAWLGRWGFVDDINLYRQILRSADIALSTAIHDFQGLSILEAVAAGAIPVVPNRLAYAELFCDIYTYDSMSTMSNDKNLGVSGSKTVEFEDEIASCVDKIVYLASNVRENHGVFAPDLNRLCWTSLRAQYHDLLEGVSLGSY